MILILYPIQNKINEPDLRRDFKNFCRHICLRWHFRNKGLLSLVTSRLSHFNHHVTPPTCYPNLEVFLRRIEYIFFEIPDKCPPYSNLSKEE